MCNSRPRDARLLSELRFANHILDENVRVTIENRVRQILADVGISFAQGIIDLGCTGIFGKVSNAHVTTRFILENIGGAGTGLPCYVPSDKFCLIHNCVGALEPGQKGPEPHPGMIRDLTPEEQKQAKMVQAVAKQHALNEITEHFGAEVHSEPEVEELEDVLADIKHKEGFSLQSIRDKPICDEHAVPSLGCKYCVVEAILAQSIVTAKALLAKDGRTEHFYLAFNTKITFLK